MPLIKEKDLKLYYSIKEVAKMFNIRESALRYWESVFPQIQPKTTSRGIRQYTKEDIEEIRLVYNMVKVRGFKLSSAKKVLHANRSQVDKTTDIIDTLLECRTQLQEIKKQFDMLT